MCCDKLLLNDCFASTSSRVRTTTSNYGMQLKEIEIFSQARLICVFNLSSHWLRDTRRKSKLCLARLTVLRRFLYWLVQLHRFFTYSYGNRGVGLLLLCAHPEALWQWQRGRKKDLLLLLKSRENLDLGQPACLQKRKSKSKIIALISMADSSFTLH